MTGRRKGGTTLGVFGPYGSDRSGVAKYVAMSVPYLQEMFDVTIVANESRWLDPWAFDVTLYHLGNNALHRSAFRAARMRPGVSLLHEYAHTDYYFQAWPHIDGARRTEVLNLLSSAMGFAIGSLDEFFEACDRKGIDRYALDVGIERYVVEESLISLFHSRSVADKMRCRYPIARVGTLPFPVTPTTMLSGWTPVKQGTDPETFKFGIFGFIGEYKRVSSVLAAWSAWADRPADARLLLVGARQIDLEYEDNTVIELGYVDDEEFVRLLASVDCGIQLREPSLGETSAPAAWMVAHRRPVILSDIPEMRDLGDHDRAMYLKSGEALVSDLVKAMGEQYMLGRRASTTFDAHFSWSNWLSIVSECLTTTGG